MKRYSSVTLHVSLQNPISRKKLKITSTKIQISIKKNPEWCDQKQIEAIRFWNGFYDKSAQTDCSKEMWVRILKGLQHLTTVIRAIKMAKGLRCYVRLLMWTVYWHPPKGFSKYFFANQFLFGLYIFFFFFF